MNMIAQLQFSDIVLILGGIVMGTAARIITLRVDNRQNPSFPGGVFINLVTGFIASILGAVAIPAVMAKDFTAVTFLALAIQHFREIRKLEGESLSRLESTEYTKRGEAYIDGISKTYEARNYISLLTSFFTVVFMKAFYTSSLLLNCLIGLISGSAVIYLLKTFTKGKTVDDICTITEGRITVKGSELYVDGMFVTNLLGTEKSRQMLLNEGLAIVITAKKEKYQVTLDNQGQRQALLFEAIRSLGVKRFKFARKNYETGKTVIALVPIIHDVEGMINAIRKTPILENSRKLDSIMSAGKGDGSNE